MTGARRYNVGHREPLDQRPCTTKGCEGERKPGRAKCGPCIAAVNRAYRAKQLPDSPVRQKRLGKNGKVQPWHECEWAGMDYWMCAALGRMRW